MSAVAKKGFTLLEVTLASFIIAVIMGICFSAIFNAYRAAKMEESVLRLDINANRAAWELSNALRSAVLPIINPAKNGSLGDVINSPTRGFGRHGEAWVRVLEKGVDCLPFAKPIDYGGDGDFLDADLLPELGLVLPNGSMSTAVAAAYRGAPNNHLDGGHIHPWLARVDPGDLNLDAGATEVDVSSSRFEAGFTFPAGADRAYAMIRFAPRRAGPKPFVIAESAIDRDLNGDGDLGDRFLLGHLEILYPPWSGEDGAWTKHPTAPYDYYVQAITEDVVLLQTNNLGEDFYQPLLRLEYPKSGEMAIHLRLLLYEEFFIPIGGREDGEKMVRKYDTLIGIRGA